MNYILDTDGTPVICPDLHAWGIWFSSSCQERTAAVTKIDDRVRVSTVFLGIDHNFTRQGSPILWETMVFGGKRKGYQRRYHTREEALRGHAETVRLVRSLGPLSGRQRTRALWRRRGRR